VEITTAKPLEAGAIKLLRSRQSLICVLKALCTALSIGTQHNDKEHKD
jgi:hypothetical protein